ncbi:MAG: glycogen debranching enzyme N-terminal domain-containing protein [Verrucomicrobia bacterium]|nr:glycogen debranching enzyme N-terminal domain-containing protein [Verrucomicrobiota bacterium]
MDTPLRQVDLTSLDHPSPHDRLRLEWLVTNGLGGYASGCVSGAVARRYHGLLVAALPDPFGRVVLLNQLSEHLHLPDGDIHPLEVAAESGRASENALRLEGFRLELGLPVWTYRLGQIELERRLFLVHGQNTVHVRYELLSPHPPVTLSLRPAVQFRGHEQDVEALPADYSLLVQGQRCEIAAPHLPFPLRLSLFGAPLRLHYEGGSQREATYAIEAERGYRSRGQLWSPGALACSLTHGRPVTLVASGEEWATILALSPEAAWSAEQVRRQRLLAVAAPAVRVGPAAELVLAADQFIITPCGRREAALRARAAGDELRTVIAGYHWFTDWGRDTMISLEGLTLVTGRHREAAWILRTFVQAFQDGLIPNLFPEGAREGLYHTADATLWFFHALSRYERYTGDSETVRQMLPTLLDALEHHFQGTKFGIGIDPADGLLRQGEEGYQLTWMDAKVDGWVVTPRRGKAVELNALWYNALCLTAAWSERFGYAEAAETLRVEAERARQAFQERFWNADLGCLFDVVDGPDGTDPAVRPNQIFALSLDHPILAPERWESVLQVVRRELLTPFGLRSLAPGHPDYKSRYFGDLRARDAAYHQGTVWGWLIGPFVDAWLRVYPEDQTGAGELLASFEAHLGTACAGSISEVFDAESPFVPRACIAQAWSVAEVLRCLARLGEGPATPSGEGDRPSPT